MRSNRYREILKRCFIVMKTTGAWEDVPEHIECLMSQVNLLNLELAADKDIRRLVNKDSIEEQEEIKVALDLGGKYLGTEYSGDEAEGILQAIKRLRADLAAEREISRRTNRAWSKAIAEAEAERARLDYVLKIMGPDMKYVYDRQEIAAAIRAQPEEENDADL